jgi:hypothetical protein
MEYDAPKVDEVYDALTHPTRREILRYLSDLDAPTPLPLLGEALHERLSEAGDETVDERALRVALVHAHLPKLDDAGLVDWDGERAALSPGLAGLRISPPVVDGRFDFTVTHRETSP